MNTLKISALFLLFFSNSDAFGIDKLGRSHFQTALNLENKIADMIDKALYRQDHKQESEREWNKKNKKVIEPEIPSDFTFAGPLVEDSENFMIKRKDKRLADANPQAYCADRCVSTGNCDVYEDMFHMSPKEVMEFCTECVLSEDEEPCDVPEAMLEDKNDLENTIRP